MPPERSADPMANGDVPSWPKHEVPIGSGNVCCQTGPKADITNLARMMLWTAPTLRHRSAIGWLR
jgi:hypothetical protein